MRYLLMFIIAVSVILGCQQKAPEIPEVVMNSFKSLYQDAVEVEWELEDGYFEVEFEIGKNEMSVLFDDLGNVLETESVIEIEALPDTIQEILISSYTDHEVLEVEKVMKDSLIYYEVELMKADVQMELIFDEYGVIKQNLIEEKENEEEEDSD